MSFTSDQVSAMEVAISSGTTTVEVNGRKVTYRSLSEMMKILNMMKADVDGNTSNGGVLMNVADFTPTTS